LTPFPPFPPALWLYGDGGNDRLKGGPGNNVLLGGDGDDLLVGGSNRDILIGGRGADRLAGNAEDDILIAGYTLFDADEAALAVILGVWVDPTQSYQQRVAALTTTGVGANQAVKLNASTVSDGAQDVLTGTSGQDWFLANVSGGGVLDKLTDLSAAEFATDLAFINGL
jgi:Ca2+-binding RTX toxin-like protein